MYKYIYICVCVCMLFLCMILLLSLSVLYCISTIIIVIIIIIDIILINIITSVLILSLLFLLFILLFWLFAICHVSNLSLENEKSIQVHPFRCLCGQCFTTRPNLLRRHNGPGVSGHRVSLSRELPMATACSSKILAGGQVAIELHPALCLTWMAQVPENVSKLLLGLWLERVLWDNVFWLNQYIVSE